jgi:hypothetical protein
MERTVIWMMDAQNEIELKKKLKVLTCRNINALF